MECSPELEELLEVVFNLSGREIDVLIALCGENLTVEDIAENIGRDRSTVQRYLSGLRKAGLVSVSREGRKHVYSVEKSVLKQQTLDRLDSWVAEKKESVKQM